MKKSKNPRSD